MRSSIICGLMVTSMVISSGCQSSMPRWDWWRGASNSNASAASIAQSSAPALPSSVASSGVSAPTGQYPATPANAYGTPNMANATPVSASATAGAVGPQTSPYNPHAYGPPAGATGYAGVQSASPPPASPNGTANAAYTNTTASGGRYGAPAASPASGYQSGSRYDGPATPYSQPAQGAATMATSGPTASQGGTAQSYANPGVAPATGSPAAGAYPDTSGYGVANSSGNTQTAPVDYRNQAPVSTADARSQYNPVQGVGPAAPTSTAGTPYRPAGTGTYTPIGTVAPSSGTQPVNYQQAAPTGQHNPAPASPTSNESRYGGRY